MQKCGNMTNQSNNMNNRKLTAVGKSVPMTKAGPLNQKEAHKSHANRR
jgi:hypothetical protein